MESNAMTGQQVLDSGTLREHQEGRPPRDRPFSIRRLGPADLDAIDDLQRRIVTSLQDPSLYHPNPRERLAQCLGQEGLMIGTLVDDQPIGFRSIFYPGSRPDNLGRDIGLPAQDLATVAHLERSAVLPAYTGNRLQIRMTGQALKIAVAEHRLRHLFSTVAPGNAASILDKFAVGMLIVRAMKKYGDLWRFIFHRDLDDPIAIIPETAIEVPAPDLATQVRLVEEEGYIGSALREEDHGVIMVYARPARPIRRS